MKEILHFLDVMFCVTFLLNIIVLIINFFVKDIDLWDARSDWFKFLFFLSFCWVVSKWIL